MAISRNQFTKLMQRDMYKWFFERYDTFNPVYPQVFEVIQSNSAFEQETTGIGMGQLSERPEGEEIVNSNALEGFTVYAKNRTYSDSFSLTMETQEDTPAEKIANLLRDLATTWSEGVTATKETYAANVFNYGGYTAGNAIFNGTITGVSNNGVADPSGDFIYDGKPFFALSGNNHTAKNGSTYYNATANAFSSANLQTAYQLMTVTNNRNERGEIISLMPDTILFNPNLRFSVRQVLENTDTANLKSNVQGLLKPIEWHYLTDTDAWYVGKAKKGIKFMERKAPVIDFYQDEKSKKYYATIDTRFGVMVNNWRFWVSNNLATS